MGTGYAGWAAAWRGRWARGARDGLVTSGTQAPEHAARGPWRRLGAERSSARRTASFVVRIGAIVRVGVRPAIVFLAAEPIPGGAVVAQHGLVDPGRVVVAHVADQRGA